LNDDNHVKTLLSKYEKLQKELNEVKNKQQEQDVRLDKSQERLDNHEGKLKTIWKENALLKEIIFWRLSTNISARKRSECINISTTGHNDNISQESSKDNSATIK
jgi:hypothetical protein